ncbi:MAG: Ig-like domain-containing protein [Verrucomicrobiota bacterium]|nr:Ig-like domain-containing protein [Verrucomicrobiota bacterium]
MRWVMQILGVAVLLQVGPVVWAINPLEYAVTVSATVVASPPQIHLKWPANSAVRKYTIRRKALMDNAWSRPLATLGQGSVGFVDSVPLGSAFEYEIEAETTHVSSGRSVTAYGYIYAGQAVPLPDYRGKLILLVESSVAGPLSTEIHLLEEDLISEGWVVIRRTVSSQDNPRNVRALIQNEYTADPAGVKAVYLLGRIPVPYSGLIYPDLHIGHQGAWPADAYYGEMNSEWTDYLVNKTDSEAEINDNVPGDGKFDQSVFPSEIELQVGRVDLSNMPEFAQSEIELLRAYLMKVRNYRHRIVTAVPRGLIRDNFGDLNGDAPAVDAWRAFPVFFGTGEILEIGPDSFFDTLGAESFLWAYGCGGGDYTKADGVGTTHDFATRAAKSFFYMLHGSYFGDWNSKNNFLRAPLASSNYGIAVAWAGLPHWYFHHMGLGETIGFSTRIAQNNRTLYKNHVNLSPGEVHIALMGDPTLRMHTASPPRSLRQTGGSGLQLAWDSSPERGAMYHVYHAASAAGPFTRLTAAPISTTTYSQANLLPGTYMVRAVRLELTASGSFWNGSPGVFLKITGGGDPNPSVLSITALDGSASEANNDVGVFRLQRSGSLASSLNVSFEMQGTATPGIDYSNLQSVVFQAGNALLDVTVHPLTDTLEEGDETIVMKLNPGNGYSLSGPATASVLLRDHLVNTAPVISGLINRTIQEDQNSGVLQFTVTDTQTPANLIQVNVSSSVDTLVPQSNIILGGSGANRTLTITPMPNASGSTEITVVATDGTLNSQSSFILTVQPVNDSPTADSFAVETTEDQATQISLHGQDPEGAPLFFEIVTTPSKGSLIGIPPNVSYLPSTNFSGTDALTYRVGDGSLFSAQATVFINIAAVNDPPAIAAIPNVEIVQGQSSGLIPLTIFDPDNLEADFSVTATTTNHIMFPAGSFLLAENTLTITPLTNVHGTGSVQLIVSDGMATATNSIIVTIRRVNQPPVAIDDLFTTDPGVALELSADQLLANDYDPDSTNELQLIEVDTTSGEEGKIVLQDGTLIYNPPVGFTGEDIFYYTVEDPDKAQSRAAVKIEIGQFSKIISLQRGANGICRLEIDGFRNRVFEVEAKSGLGAWVKIGEGSSDSQGQAEFEDKNAVTLPERFYRIRWR